MTVYRQHLTVAGVTGAFMLVLGPLAMALLAMSYTSSPPGIGAPLWLVLAAGTIPALGFVMLLVGREYRSTLSGHDR